MKLSTRTRYGLRLLVELAESYGSDPVQISLISERQEISEKYLGQIVIQLKNGGLISAIRGAHGGYILSKDPGEVTLLEIVEMLEGDISIVDCTKDPSSCSRSDRCATFGVWQGLSRVMKDYLSSITLERLVINCKNESGILNYCI